MFTMYDSVTIDQVPNAPHAFACYINGRFANEKEAKQRFPHARILTISVGGNVAADCYDVENGDYHPDQAAELFNTARNAGIWRPCFYADLSNMPAVQGALSSVVHDRSEVRLWVAYYNGQTDLPAEYDAHQFTDKALGRNLDESICRDTFFKAVPPAPPKPVDKAYAAKVLLDVDSGTWRVESLPFEDVPA